MHVKFIFCSAQRVTVSSRNRKVDSSFCDFVTITRTSLNRSVRIFAGITTSQKAHCPLEVHMGHVCRAYLRHSTIGSHCLEPSWHGVKACVVVGHQTDQNHQPIFSENLPQWLGTSSHPWCFLWP